MRHDELLALAKEHGHIIVIDDNRPPSREDLVKALDEHLIRERRFQNPVEEMRKLLEAASSTLSDSTFYISSFEVDHSNNWLEIPWSRTNGDLSYLYRKTYNCQYHPRQHRHEIRQPCWSSRRWRSITSKTRQR